MDSLLNPILPKWIEAAGIQGRTYDEIYSAGALIQPAHVRESRARALAGDMEKLLNREDAFEVCARPPYISRSAQEPRPMIHHPLGFSKINRSSNNTITSDARPWASLSMSLCAMPKKFLHYPSLPSSTEAFFHRNPLGPPSPANALPPHAKLSTNTKTASSSLQPPTFLKAF